MAMTTVFSFKRPSWDHPPFEELQAIAPIQPTAVVQESLLRGDRHWYVQALATPTGFYDVDEQTSIQPGSAVFLHGYAYRYDRPQPEVVTARQLGQAFSLSRFDELAGEYAVIHLDGSGTLTAVADPQGLQGLFYVETEDLFAVSTRPSMLALLAQHRSIDTRTLAWISAIGYRVGTSTSFSGIKAIPQERALIWDGQLRFARRRGALASGQELSIGLRRQTGWFEDQLERSVAAAGTAVQLASGQDRVALAITGGKDSRMVLALCLAAGLGKRLTLYTTGVPDHPDVIVGKQIAEAIGVPHQTNTPRAADGSVLAPDEFMHKLAGVAYQADGLVGAWDNFLTLETARHVGMSGHMGEVLKGYAKRPFDPTKPLDPIELVTLQGPFDPMAVLYPAARDQLREDLAAQLERYRTGGFTFADLPDLFYYANRIPNWLGTIRQIQAFHHEFVRPLAVPPLMEMAFVATAEERKQEMLHFEIIKRLAPQLIDIPFAMQTWHPALGAAVRAPVVLSQQSSTRAFGSWQYSVNHGREIRDRLVATISETSGSSLWSAVDADKLIRRLRGPELGMMELISLLGVIPGAMFSTECFTAVKLQSAGSKVDLVSYQWPGRARQRPTAVDRLGGEATSPRPLVDPGQPRTRASLGAEWSRYQRRLRKLVREPERFLADSRFGMLRKAARVVPLLSGFRKRLAGTVGRSRNGTGQPASQNAKVEAEHLFR